MGRLYWIHMDPPQSCRRSRKALGHSQPIEERIIDMHDENASEGIESCPINQCWNQERHTNDYVLGQMFMICKNLIATVWSRDWAGLLPFFQIYKIFHMLSMVVAMAFIQGWGQYPRTKWPMCPDVRSSYLITTFLYPAPFLRCGRAIGGAGKRAPYTPFL